MGSPCVYTFKGKDYSYEGFLGMLHDGGMESLIEEGSLVLGKDKEESLQILQTLKTAMPEKFAGKTGEQVEQQVVENKPVAESLQKKETLEKKSPEKLAIEQKKADIEKRRQEELKDYWDKQFKQLPNENEKEREKNRVTTELRNKGSLIQQLVDKAESFSEEEMRKWLNTNDAIQLLDEFDSNNISNYWELTRQEPEIINKAKKHILEIYTPDIDKINAKYDAELAALEKEKPDEVKAESEKLLSDLKIKKEDAKAKIAEGFSDLADIVGAKKNIVGEERAKVVEAIKKIAEGLVEYAAAKGIELRIAVKEALKGHQEITDDLIDEALTKIEGGKQNATKTGKQQKGNLGKHPGTIQGQRKAGQGKRAEREAKKPEADNSNRNGNGEEKQEITEKEWLKDINKFAEKFKRLTFKELQAARKEIADAIKHLSTAEKKQITRGQALSILNRLTHATSESKFKALQGYVGEVLDKAKYGAQLARAKGIQQKVKEANRGQDSKFGSFKDLADMFEAIDVRQLTYEQVIEFNKISSKILASSKVPNAKFLLQATMLYGDIMKPEKDVSTANDMDSLINKVALLLQMPLDSVRDYISISRALGRARKIYSELINEATDEEREAIESLIGNITDQSNASIGAIEESLNEFKSSFTDYVFAKVNSARALQAASLFDTAEERHFVRRYLDVSHSDLESLSISDLLAFNEGIDNLMEGNITPYMVKDLMTGVNVAHDIKTNTMKAFEAISKSKLWDNLISRGMVDWLRGAGRKVREKLSRNAPKYKLNEGDAILRELMSTQAFRIDTKFGNFSDGKIGKSYADVGAAIQKANMEKERTDKLIHDAYKQFKKGKDAKEEEKLRTWVGFFLIERRWQSSDKFNEKLSEDNAIYNDFVYNKNYANTRKLSDDPRAVDDEKAKFNEFLSFIKNKGFTKEVNGIQVIDIGKVQDYLFNNSGTKALVEAIDKYLDIHKGMNIIASLANGRSISFGSNYFPFRSRDVNKEINFENIKSEIESFTNQAKMVAGSTYEWTEKQMRVEVDPIKAISRYGEDIRRNYFVYPVIREKVMAIKKASRQLSDELIKQDGVTDKNIRTLGDKIAEDIFGRVAMYFNTGIYRNEGRMLKFLEKGTKKALLAKPAKALTEVAANFIRMVISSGSIPVESISRAEKYKDTYKKLISNHMGDKYFSRWAEEVSTPVFTDSETAKWIESKADWFITIADTTIGKPLFANEFLKSFKDATGRDFDEQQFESNPDYEFRYRDEIDRASYNAISRVEELFNNKNPMSNQQLISFIGGLWRPRQNNPVARTMNFLMSFGRNEATQIADSVRKIKYGSAKQRAEGTRDLFSLTASNFMYGVVRKSFSILEGILLYNIFTGGGDDDEEKKADDMKFIDLQKQQLKSGKFYMDYATLKILPDLALGGSSNLFEFSATVADYLIQRAGGLDDDTKQAIKNFFETRYMQQIPVYGMTEKAFIAAAPGYSSEVIRDLISASTSGYDLMQNTYLAVHDGFVSKNFTEKEFVDFVNLINLSMKYYMPNPVTPVIDRRIRQVIFDLRKEELKEEKKRNKQKQAEEKKAKLSGK